MDRIKNINFIVLKFPTAHYISSWRLIQESWHLIALVNVGGRLTGIGEGTPYGTTALDDYRYAMKLAKRLKCLSIERAIEVLRETEYSLFGKGAFVNFGAFLALESALYDVLAKLYEDTIASLLGGMYRNLVPVAGTVFLNDPIRMVNEARGLIIKGVKHLKLKIPYSIEELENMLNIFTRYISKNEFPDIIIRVDANECFKNYNRAKKALKILEKYNIDIIEQPLPKSMLRETAKLRREFHPSLKIMLDESLINPRDIETFASIEAADIINFHPSKLGCLSITREAILQAQKLGLKTQIGSALMTEVGLVHYLNLASSLPVLDYPLEEMGLYNIYGYSIFNEEKRKLLDIKQGTLIVPPYIEVFDLIDSSYLSIFNIRNFNIAYYIPSCIRNFLNSIIKTAFL